MFADAVDVTGVVLTKLDGSAKGGIVFAVQHELGIPVKLVGLGEGAGDLVDFDADEFVEASARSRWRESVALASVPVMFDSLSDRFESILQRVKGKGRLSESDVDEVTREIRLALAGSRRQLRCGQDLHRTSS